MDVSLIINVSVANTVPETLPDRILIVAVSAPSVEESAVGVTVKLPEFELRVNESSLVAKSVVGVTVQKSVALGAFELETVKLPADPSFIEAGAVTVYVAEGDASVVLTKAPSTPPTVRVVVVSVE